MPTMFTCSISFVSFLILSIVAVVDSADTSRQNLTLDVSKNLLGLTGSNVTISLDHLVNDDSNEIQDLKFNNANNELSLSKSSSGVIDLSHLDNPVQDLEFNPATLQVGLTDSAEKVNLSALKQDLVLNGNTVAITSSSGNGVDLSSFRVVVLQASIEAIDGDATTLGRRLHSRVGASSRHRGASRRKLKKKDGESKPKVSYGGMASLGWALIFPGRLVGMSITLDCPLDKGELLIEVVDCTSKDDTKPLGSFEDMLVLKNGSNRTNSIEFKSPINVDAGAVLCLHAVRVEATESNDACTENAGSLLLMLEQ